MAKYIKIPTDFFEREPIKALEQHDVAYERTVLLYLELLCQAYKKSAKGIFTIGDIELTDWVLESVFRCEDIGICLSILENIGLIKRTEKSIHVFRFWEDAHDRNSTRYRRWRTEVFTRDQFRCVECGTRKNLQAHHVKSWKNNKDLRYVVSNGITLCRKCHLEAHGGCWRNGDLS